MLAIIFSCVGVAALISAVPLDLLRRSLPMKTILVIFDLIAAVLYMAAAVLDFVTVILGASRVKRE